MLSLPELTRSLLPCHGKIDAWTEIWEAGPLVGIGAAAAATVEGRIRPSWRFTDEESPAVEATRDAPTDMSQRSGGSATGNVRVRGRQTGWQNILDFGIVPHTGCW